MSTIWVLLIFPLLLAWLFKRWKDPYRRMPNGARKLPGPWTLPFIGRVHDIPPERTWLHFYKWSKQFGPIYRHELFGTTHVWISSEEVAKDLLAKQSSSFSDRPVVNNLPISKTGGEYLPLLGENEIWVRQRKFGHHLMTLSARNSQHHYPVIETKRLLYKLLIDTPSYRSLLEDHSSRNICRLAWGSPEAAPILQRVTMALLTVISPSGALPNVLSPLACLPEFVSPWKKYERARYQEERSFFLLQLAKVRKDWVNGKAKPCYMQMFFDSQAKCAVDDLEGAYQVGMMAIAGALTIAAPMMSFVLAMVLHPGWLARVQEEVDRVCGDTLPDMKDMENLPVLRAVVKEVLRWRPPVPTGIPHESTKDCIYNGYFIPAGSTIHALEWGITRDPKIYPNADWFNPGRWLDPAYPTYREPLTTFPRLEGHSQFGYGRRACMGVDIVNHELFLVCGALAWAYNLKKKIGKDGREIVPKDLEYSSLLIAKPDWFELDLIVRDEKKRQKIVDQWEEAAMIEGADI
ncbi:Cytochrome P450 monooxygenase psoD [Hyphodiscus hymeniophilus]|uniref:Cytochrome P450 monooxygenase psoD n=1 Tax=Hyphodiscus hymeniophilus TaxID=353542 RepID=A0A9P6VIF3_9HELO|nr:Cytochrome P450 monooxygenase psoD [Hyphodiscus hymeniophilus]